MSANSSSFAISPSASLKNPEVIRHTIALANTEESFIFPANTKYFTIQNEGQRFVRVAYAIGETNDGGNFYVLPPFDSRTINGIEMSSVTIYLRSSGAEIVTFDIWK